MPYLMQMLGCAGMLVGLALVVWLGFWMLVLMAVLSVFYAGWLYLVRQGIVNPTPGSPVNTVVIEETTVIDGVYETLPERKDEEKEP